MPLGVFLQVGLIAAVIELHYSCCILQLILDFHDQEFTISCNFDFGVERRGRVPARTCSSPVCEALWPTRQPAVLHSQSKERRWPLCHDSANLCPAQVEELPWTIFAYTSKPPNIIVKEYNVLANGSSNAEKHSCNKNTTSQIYKKTCNDA